MAQTPRFTEPLSLNATPLQFSQINAEADTRGISAAQVLREAINVRYNNTEEPA